MFVKCNVTRNRPATIRRQRLLDSDQSAYVCIIVDCSRTDGVLRYQMYHIIPYDEQLSKIVYSVGLFVTKIPGDSLILVRVNTRWMVQELEVITYRAAAAAAALQIPSLCAVVASLL